MRIVSLLFSLLLFFAALTGFSQDSTKTKKLASKSFHISPTTILFGTPKWHAFKTGFTGNLNKHTFSAELTNSNYESVFADPYYNLFRTFSYPSFPTGIPVQKQNYSLGYSNQLTKELKIHTTYTYNSSKADYSEEKHRYYYSDSITDMTIYKHSRLNSSTNRFNTQLSYTSKKYSDPKAKYAYTVDYRIYAGWYKESAQIESSGPSFYKSDSSSTNLTNSITGTSKGVTTNQNLNWEMRIPTGRINLSADYSTSKRNQNDSLFNSGINPDKPLINYTNSQHIQSRINNDDYKLSLRYAHKKHLSIAYTFELQEHRSDRLNNSSVHAEQTSPLFSNIMLFEKRSNNISAIYSRTIRNVSFRTTLSYEAVSINTKESFPSDTQLLRTYHNPGVVISLETPLFHRKAGHVSGRYIHSYNQPDITQLQPYTDNTQLNQWMSGNRGLTQSTKDLWSFSYDIPKLFKRIKADVTGTLESIANERAAVIQLISPDSLYGGLWQAYKGSPMFSYANLHQQQTGKIELNTKSRITKKISFDINAGSMWYMYAEMKAQNYTGDFRTELKFKFLKAITSGKLSARMHTEHVYRPAMIENNLYFMNTADHSASLGLSFSLFKLFNVEGQHRASFQNISFSQNAYKAFDLRTATTTINLNKNFFKRYTAKIIWTQDYTKDLTHNRTFDNHFLHGSLTYKSKYGLSLAFEIQNILNRNTQVGQTFNTYYIESYSNANMGRIFFLKLIVSPESFVRKIKVNLKKGAKPKLLIDLKMNK